ncbi:MAG TPA: cytochrome D1 domain-containing protein [Candidatus Eisenbacteria bacterium]|nr:cytochrome D1 domain-containing protein [Candidatus Eisenbacteria bacterium]
MEIAEWRRGLVVLAAVICLVLLLVGREPSAWAKAPKEKAVLLVINQGDASVSVVDPVEKKEVRTIAEEVSGVHGHEVEASPDGKTAYVPIYGSSGVGKPGIDGREMLVIDIASGQITHRVEFGEGVRPHCVVYDPVSKMLYVTTELKDSVTIVDPKTLKIVGAIPTGQAESHMLAISPDGTRGYTANVGPGTVSVLDMQSRKTIAVIPISKVTQRIAVSRDGKMVFSADQTKPQLAVIDTTTNKMKTWVELPAVAYGTGATLDGKWLVVTTLKGVAVVDLATLKVAKMVDVPGNPQEVLIAPDGKTAYVSCAMGNEKGKVAAIDVKDWKVETLIEVGRFPDGLAWAAGGK